MKFLAVLVTPLILASAAVAQSVNIGAPTSGTILSPGSNFTLDLNRPDSLTGSEEVAVVIALRACGNNPCASPDEVLGDILYNGPYHPQFDSPPDEQPPHQNFSLTVPEYIANGTALLSVTHLTLIGVSFALW